MNYKSQSISTHNLNRHAFGQSSITENEQWKSNWIKAHDKEQSNVNTTTNKKNTCIKRTNYKVVGGDDFTPQTTKWANISISH